MSAVYVSIGNSDDKLTQADWSSFRKAVDDVVRRAADHVYGAWVSPSTDPWQNACWGFEVTDSMAVWLRNRLENLTLAYRQDSIAWAETPEVEFLSAAAGTTPA